MLLIAPLMILTWCSRKVQNIRPVAGIVSANELFTPAHVSLESCLLQWLTVYRMEVWEEAANVFCELVACVKIDMYVSLLKEMLMYGFLSLLYIFIHIFMHMDIYVSRVEYSIIIIYSSFIEVKHCISMPHCMQLHCDYYYCFAILVIITLPFCLQV